MLRYHGRAITDPEMMEEIIASGKADLSKLDVPF
jgi:hypothetical protein